MDTYIRDRLNTCHKFLPVLKYSNDRDYCYYFLISVESVQHRIDIAPSEATTLKQVERLLERLINDNGLHGWSREEVWDLLCFTFLSKWTVGLYKLRTSEDRPFVFYLTKDISTFLTKYDEILKRILAVKEIYNG